MFLWALEYDEHWYTILWLVAWGIHIDKEPLWGLTFGQYMALFVTVVATTALLLLGVLGTLVGSL